MKFTPFVIFLIILFVFVGLYIFMMNNKNKYQIQAYKEKELHKYEGFIDFENNISTNTFVNIPQYSYTNSVLKLYDNIYFDNTNGNLIEIDGLEVTGNPADDIGSTIQNLYITTRDNPTDVNTYSINGQTGDMNIDDSYIQKVSDSYVAYSYQNQSSTSSQSVTFYTAWQDLTCINVFSNTANINNNEGTPLNSINLLQNYCCIPGKTPEYNYIQTTDFIDSSVPYYDDLDPNNNTFVVLPLYNPNVQVYQLSHFICFDVANGYLILINGDGSNSITVYDNVGSEVNMNTPSSALTSSTNQMNFGSGSGIITPGFVELEEEIVENCPQQNSVKCPDIYNSVVPPAAPVAPSNVNMQLDTTQIANMFGNFAKPLLTCLANTANSQFTIPPVAEFRDNFAKAFIKEYPSFGYDKAYKMADEIYKLDIPYYKDQPDDGTIMGTIIGKRTYIEDINPSMSPSISPSQTSQSQPTRTSTQQTQQSTQTPTQQSTQTPTQQSTQTPTQQFQEQTQTPTQQFQEQTQTPTQQFQEQTQTPTQQFQEQTQTPTQTQSTETFTSSISSFNPYMVIDKFGQNVIIYNQINNVDTIVLLGGYSDATNQVFEIINAVRFIDSGVDTGSVNTQQYNYQNNYINPNNMINNNNILKSQIPQMYNALCSVCNGNNNVNCPNCGGNGGNGTMSSNGVSMVDNTNFQQQQRAQNYNPADVPITNSGSSSFLPMLDDFSKFGR